MIYPNNFEQKIGFNEVRTLLKSKCLSTLGTGLVDDMAMSDDRQQQYELGSSKRVSSDSCKLKPTISLYNISSIFALPYRDCVFEGTHLDEQELFDLFVRSTPYTSLPAFSTAPPMAKMPLMEKIHAFHTPLYSVLLWM